MKSHVMATILFIFLKIMLSDQIGMLCAV